MTITQEEILKQVEEMDVRYLRLIFTDILGTIKNVEVPITQLKKVLSNKMMFDGSSIEGFVRSLVTDHGLIKDPTVSVNSRKNKCMVSVKGAIVPSENIIKRSQLIQEEIASGLTEFFGINHNVKLKISVSDFKPKEAAKKTTSRVK